MRSVLSLPSFRAASNMPARKPLRQSIVAAGGHRISSVIAATVSRPMPG